MRIWALCLVICGEICFGQAQFKYPFQNPSLPPEQRISDLLARMTVQEKVYNFGIDPSIPRLGVVGSGHVEGLHGLALGGYAEWQGEGKPPIPTTQFPEANGLGQMWDSALLQQVAHAEGYEARYAAQNERYKGTRTDRIVGGLLLRAPNADLARDPRWGRNSESYGEDPYLVGTLATAFVEGLQGDDPRYWLSAALMKHFLANSNENGREGSSSNFDTRLFREYYSVPFRMGIEEGGANAMMTSYNAWNGVPMTAHPVLKSIVEKEWGFNGILCTDRRAFTDLVTQHNFYKSLDEAAAATTHAGINQYLDHWEGPITAALNKHLIPEKDLDDDLRGVFRVMLRLGQLDPPSMVPYAKIGRDTAAGETAPWNSPEHRALARKVTDESIVLLKNQGQTLPLNPQITHSIAVIGPYADKVLFGWYSGAPPYTVSPLEGIRKRVASDVSVQFAKGEDLNQAESLARKSDVAIVVLGNDPMCGHKVWAGKCPSSEGKEGRDRDSLALEQSQEEIAKRVYAANSHTVLVLITGFPYAITWEQDHLPAILEMAPSSEEEGTALADVLFGNYNPAGRLTQTWPRSIDQLPPMMDYDIRHGSTYMYFRSKPLYAFGYGLSYTTFAYSNLKVSSSGSSGVKEFTVSVNVSNTGTRAGDEVVQMYVRYLQPKVSRPGEQLVGFQRISLKPGETKTVTFPLKSQSLAYWNEGSHTYRVEPGKIAILVGSSSDAIHLQETTTIDVSSRENRVRGKAD